MNDTITAISSGNINQPISIIRISGSDAFSIVSKIFNGKIGLDKTITYGNIIDKGVVVDEVLIAWFVGPKTFTGEDIVEINAHGGVVNTNKILKLILVNGARIAEPGEFTRRAFINGKIDLIKAEAIHDLIFASTEEQSSLAVNKFDGQTSNLINKLLKDLIFIISTIETNIDYPEYEDIEDLSNKTIKPKIIDLIKKINDIIESSKSSRYVYEGVDVAIVGQPNVGKSSLLNALINEDKAIVSDIPGTTRDVVEGKVQIGQILFNFQDTAGLHFSTDKIESLGMKKALEALNKDKLIIHVINSEVGENYEDKKIEEKSHGKQYIKVFNKSDLNKRKSTLNISALKGDIKPLLDEIKKHFKDIDLHDEKYITNTRQLVLIEKAKKSLETALKSIENNFEPDEVIIDIRAAWKNLASIVGEGSDEKILDEMFKNFCLGK